VLGAVVGSPMHGVLASWMTQFFFVTGAPLPSSPLISPHLPLSPLVSPQLHHELIPSPIVADPLHMLHQDHPLISPWPPSPPLPLAPIPTPPSPGRIRWLARGSGTPRHHGLHHARRRHRGHWAAARDCDTLRRARLEDPGSLRGAAAREPRPASACADAPRAPLDGSTRGARLDHLWLCGRVCRAADCGRHQGLVRSELRGHRSRRRLERRRAAVRLAGRPTRPPPRAWRHRQPDEQRRRLMARWQCLRESAAQRRAALLEA
jgi:hypothetical protein